jgi:hypothetical protein
MKKSNTYLPVFPGFYGTLFEVNYSIIEEDLKELIFGFSKDYTEYDIDIEQELKDFFWRNEENYTDYADYQNRIVNQCVNAIESQLIGLKIIKSIKLEKLVSPREYNFYNDSINVEITFTENNISNIKRIIKENFAKWSKLLKSRYTSYSGFFSSYDNYPESEEWQIDFAITESHQSGAILDFILSINEYNTESLYNDCEIYLSMDTEKFENDFQNYLDEKTGVVENKYSQFLNMINENIKENAVIVDRELKSLSIPKINFKCTGKFVEKYIQENCI